MATASSSSAVEQQSPMENGLLVEPAVPPAAAAGDGKENRIPEDTTPAKADAQLSDGFSRLELDENGKAGFLQDATNGAGGQGAGARGSQGTIGEAAHSVPQKEAAPIVQLQPQPQPQPQPQIETPAQKAERVTHSRFMREALDMARLALKTNETPVGCVLVYRGRVIARGMNATNVTRNGTRHAELMAICALLSYSRDSDLEPEGSAVPEKGAARAPLGDKTNAPPAAEETSSWGDVDPRDGHLYPYGQKLHPAPRVDASVLRECTLYVTVEPCVMCASLLRQLQIKKVYFGAVNDKFGGTGGVFRIHKNSPYSMASAPPSPAPQNGKGIARPPPEPRPVSTGAVSEDDPVGAQPAQAVQNAQATDDNPKAGESPQDLQAQATQAVQHPAPGVPDEELVVVSPVETTNHLPGDGGNIERGYEAEGGWGRDEAVTLLRQFYVQENNRAPVPRKKEGRAARLAAMMERDGHAAGPPMEPGYAARRPHAGSVASTTASALDDAPMAVPSESGDAGEAAEAAETREAAEMAEGIAA